MGYESLTALRQRPHEKRQVGRSFGQLSQAAWPAAITWPG
jgi:hypothetical protein